VEAVSGRCTRAGMSSARMAPPHMSFPRALRLGRLCSAAAAQGQRKRGVSLSRV
jgi:hypothetical protein